MPHPITSPESFITSLISTISLLAPHVSSVPDSNVFPNPVSPPPAQNFSTLLSALPKENQESITRHLTTLHFLFPHELITALDLLDRALVTRMIIGPLSRPTNDASEVLDRKPHVDIQASLDAPMGDLPSANDVHVAGVESCRRPRQQNDPSNLTTAKAGNEGETGNEVFYVQSASSQTTAAARQRRRHYTGTSSPSYEVRLAAWNCTCPAFALSAFNRITDLKSNGDDHDDQGPLNTLTSGNDHHDAGFHHSPKPQTDLEWRFGGTLTRTLSPPEDKIDPDRREASVPVCKHILAALLGKHIPGLFGSGVQPRTVTAEEGAAWAGGWGDGD